MASAPARAGTLSAALLALVSAFFLGAATAAPATSDAAERAAKGQGSRAKRAACMRRVTRSRGVSRRVAARVCRRRAHRRPGAAPGAAPTGITVSGASTVPAAPGAADARVVPAAATGCPGADAVPSAANVPAVRATVLCLVNAQRAAAGLGGLADNAPLTVAAQNHSNDMVARHYFSHASLEGTDFSARLSAAGWAGGSAGENIAWGGGALGTPAQIVAGWMNSPGHKANILSPAYSSSGVGVAIGTPGGAGGATYTHDFGG